VQQRLEHVAFHVADLNWTAGILLHGAEELSSEDG
jgi:hypothetical protein